MRLRIVRSHDKQEYKGNDEGYTFTINRAWYRAMLSDNLDHIDISKQWFQKDGAIWRLSDKFVKDISDNWVISLRAFFE